MAPQIKAMYSLYNRKKWLISHNEGADIQVQTPIHLELAWQEDSDKWQLTIIKSGPLMINQFPATKDEYLLRDVNIIEIGNEIKLMLYATECHVLEGDITTQLFQIYHSSYVLPAWYPNYHRSPRMMYHMSEEKIVVDNPPPKVQKSQENIIKIVLPPMIMMSVSVIMLFVRPNGIYILATLATTLLSLIFSVTSYFKGRKQYKKDVQARIDNYETYYEEQVKRIEKLKAKQRQGANYHYPSYKEIASMILSYDNRLYEKAPQQADFLSYSLGRGVASFCGQVSSGQSKSINLEDPLEKKAYQLVKRSQTLSDMPIINDLNHGPVGYVGVRHLVIEQLQLLMLQLAAFHSYHDIKFITLISEEEKDDWEWTNWYPHHDANTYRSIIFDQKSRDMVLNSVHQLLKDRRQEQKEANASETLRFLPEYVFFITDEHWIVDHPIMELLTDDTMDLGVHLIYVQDVMSNLPERVKTVIEIRDYNEGRFVMKNGKLLNQRIQLDHFGCKEERNELSRTLAGINHLQTLRSTIPTAITFLELYGVERIEELQIMNRWQNHSPYKSLAVPLGVNGPGEDDIIELNLHEKAHGPHGLVAGTTGSGKSEIIQSYILSLAVNFHPHDVAFLLIDYKGGGMANLFKHLPHLLGTITNLDGAQSMRALISINAELKRRQRLFAQNDVNHINQYQKLHKEGKVSEPMPHLFMISDEFAELKAEQPEFMDELISTARIGRSLGIHLILATQKPSGVVNDQIWSNSKFKLALKVADRSDSMEVLKTPDAAEIVEPGRAYLQVGNNEVYELFQSAWSGASYQPDKEDDDAVVEIYRLDQYGTKHALTEDLSGLDRQKGPVKASITELDAVVNEIEHIVSEQHIPALKRPWLPPLPTMITLKELTSIETNWQSGIKPELEAVIGFLDVPSEQDQRPVTVNLTESGNLAVFASPGYGKSTFLQTLVMDLARKHTPEQLTFYLLDFGTNGLLPLKALPHVADTISSDEEEKIQKFIKRIQTEIKTRKKKLSDYSVANIQMYEEATGEVIPEIMIVLDGFEGFKEMPYESTLLSFLIQLSREGQSIGLHLVFSAGALNGVRMQLLNNIKVKIALKQNNEADIRELVGKSQFAIDDCPGRGLIKLEEAQAFQTALPTYGDTAYEVVQNLTQEAERLDQQWDGWRAHPIPMMPEELVFSNFVNYASVKEAIDNGNIPLGLDYDNVESKEFISNQCNSLYIIGDKKDSLRKTFMHILRLCDHINHACMLLDTTNNWIDFYENITKVIIGEDIKDFVEQLTTEIDYRKEIGKNTIQYILIDDMEKFVEITSIKNEEFKHIVESAKEVGIQFILMSNYAYASNYSSIIKSMKSEITHALFVMKLSEQTLLDKPYIKNESNLSLGDMYYYEDGIYTKIKYPI